jgi:hypothetical protein
MIHPKPVVFMHPRWMGTCQRETTGQRPCSQKALRPPDGDTYTHDHAALAWAQRQMGSSEVGPHQHRREAAWWQWT